MQDLGGGLRDSVCETWEGEQEEEGKVGKREKRWRGGEEVVTGGEVKLTRVGLEIGVLGSFGTVLFVHLALQRDGMA